MKFNLSDKTKVITHWLLNDLETAKLVADTPEWKSGKSILNASVTVNGIELPFESLEDFLQYIVKCRTEELKKQYSDVEEEVERRLKERLKEEVQPLLGKLDDFRSKLEEIDSAIKPYWDV